MTYGSSLLLGLPSGSANELRSVFFRSQTTPNKNYDKLHEGDIAAQLEKDDWQPAQISEILQAWRTAGRPKISNGHSAKMRDSLANTYKYNDENIDAVFNSMDKLAQDEMSGMEKGDSMKQLERIAEKDTGLEGSEVTFTGNRL